MITPIRVNTIYLDVRLSYTIKTATKYKGHHVENVTNFERRTPYQGETHVIVVTKC